MSSNDEADDGPADSEGPDSAEDQQIDEPAQEGTPEADELPDWLRKVTETAGRLPGGGKRVAVWLPTLAAGWRATERALTLASGLRRQLDGDETLEWPDQLVEEFGDTVAELRETLPGLDEAIPAATETVELLEQRVDTDVSYQSMESALERLETVAEKVLRRLIETAFFEPEGGHPDRDRHLRRLFNRLEGLFDRLVHLWIEESHNRGAEG